MSTPSGSAIRVRTWWAMDVPVTRRTISSSSVPYVTGW